MLKVHLGRMPIYFKVNSNTNFPIQIKCKQHNQIFTHYCIECNDNICQHCTTKHSFHKLFALYKYSSEPLGTEYENYIIKNQKITFNVIKRLDDNNPMKADIQSVLNTNESINKDFLQLQKIIFKTTSAFKDSPSYSLMQLKTIQINPQTQIHFNRKENIETIFNYLKKQLQNTYVLRHIEFKEFLSIKQIQQYNRRIVCLLRLDDDRLVSSSSQPSLQIWNTTTYQSIATLSGYLADANSLIQLKNGHLASASLFSINKWDLTTYQCITTLSDKDADFTSLIQLNNDLLVYSLSNSTIKLLNAKRYQSISTFSKCDVDFLYQLRDGRLVLGSNTIVLLNLTTNERITIPTECRNKSLIELSNKRIIVFAFTGYITVISLLTNSVIRGINMFIGIFNPAVRLNESLFPFCAYRHIQIWNSNNDHIVSLFPGFRENPNYLVRLSNNRLAFSLLKL